MMSRAVSLSIVTFLAVAVSGCTGQYQSDFKIIIQNRVANAIVVTGNDSELGQIAAGQQSTFTVRLAESSPNILTDGVAPTPQGQLTLTAKDVKTNAISTVKTITLSAGSPTSVTFTAADFPVTSPTVARFSVSPNNPGIDQEVQFNASASTPNTGTFSWSFGDGATGTGVITTHKYPRAGAFTVTLTVTSDAGISATATTLVNVTTTLPNQTVNFTFSPAAPAVNQDVFFNASTSTVNGGTYTWDFGDGGTATGITATHRFPRAATYTVTVRATNSTGQSAAASRTVTVTSTSSQVTASFSFSPTNPGINQEVYFNASASQPANATLTWNFGDGTTGTGVTPTHRYAQAGNYTVTLTVTNDVGIAATTTRTVPVSATSTQVVAAFTFSPTAPGVDQEIFFDASASRPADASFSWSFGDGARASGVAPRHSYDSTGTYTVTLVVTNSFGQTATTSRTVTVSATSGQVVASFTFSPTNPGTNQDVFFNASGSRPVTATFYWTFGDGTSGSGITPVHRYAQAATYTVTLTIATENGQLATTSRNVPVGVAPSTFVADFTFSPTDPNITRGTNNVIFDPTPSSPGVVAWTWDFGDGSPVETVQRPTHVFTRVGTWVVRLTVADAEGRTATVTKNVPVTQ